MLYDLFSRSISHDEWANQLLIGHTKVEESPLKARQLMAHVVATNNIWAGRLLGTLSHLPIWPDPADFDFYLAEREGIVMLRSVVEKYRADYDSHVTYTDSRGKEWTNRVADALQHVFRHGDYHRGQINLLLRQGGLDPVDVSFISWARLQERRG